MSNEGVSLGDGLAAVVDRLARRDNAQPGDYTRDGILMCGKCNTPKQSWQNLPVFPIQFDEQMQLVMAPRLAPIACRCRAEEQEREKKRDQDLRFRHWMETHRQYGISGGLSETVTFDADDGRDPEALEICRRYVDKWTEMRENNIGIRFHGPNGTGKSFHAGIIVNALLKRHIPCIMTSFPTLLGAMEKWGEKTEIVNHLNLFDCVVIDDLGAERDSGYSYEQVYHIIDARYRQGKPLIITTNLLPRDMKHSENIMLKRIFDRVLEMCPLEVVLDGIDRRAELANGKKRLAEVILKGAYTT